MSNRGFQPSRRDVLRFGGAAAGLAALSGSSFAQPPGGTNKTLICVFLAGGNDGYNLVVPRSSAEYNAYADARQNLAIPQTSLLPITPATPDGNQYGLHPSVPELQSLFNDGKLAFVTNVGTLVEPVTKAEYEADAKPLPPQLFSHNDQQRQWESPSANWNGTTGWAGLMADELSPTWNPTNPVLSSVTLGGSAPLLVGDDTAPYALGTGGAKTLKGFWGSTGANRKVVFDQIVQASQGNVFQREFGRVRVESEQIAAQVSSALDQAPEFVTEFDSTSSLARQLEMVARMIAVQDLLGVGRQFFLVKTGGFDTHDNQETRQPELLANISRSLASFQAAMEEINQDDEVCLFTISDFGRTLSSNGDGTDHAWGAPHLVLGTPVAGGDFYGAFPELSLTSPDALNGGRIIPTQSVDQYAATLAQWFGVTNAGVLNATFPNLVNFASSDLGFL